MVYQWKASAPYFSRLDAQAVGEYLETVRAANNGRLTAEDVVRAARDESSPIHGAFDWDDQSAAEEHRKHVARVLMGSIKVVVKVQAPDGREQERITRALVAVRDAEGTQYVPIATVLASDDYRQQLIVSARRELIAFQRKYGELSELTELFASIDRVLPLLDKQEVAA